MRLLAIAVMLGLVVAACTSSKLDDLAADTCAELDGAIVLQAGPIISKAISRAERLGASGPELGDRMRELCPGTMLALESIGDDAEQRDRLPEQMHVRVVRCSQDGVTGEVVNNSDVTVDVFIDVQYLDGEGVVVDNGFGSVTGLRAGETGTWDDTRFDDTHIERCRADVDSAYEQ